MILLFPVTFLIAGALSVHFVSADRRWLRGIAFLTPFFAAGSLLIPFPISSTLSIFWQPAILFPIPIRFEATQTANLFALFFCFLLILIEVTRPLRSRSRGLFSRSLCFLLAAGGIASSFSANILTVVLVWSWIDFLSFFTILLQDYPVDINPEGISSSVARSIEILGVSFLSTAMIVFPVLENPASGGSDWKSLWMQSPSDLAITLFFLGIILRLLVVPILFSTSGISKSSRGVDVFLQILPCAITFSLLSKAWPSAIFPLHANPTQPLFMLFLAALLLFGVMHWWTSRKSFEHRDLFLTTFSAYILFAAFLFPAFESEKVFPAAGCCLILGAGILLLFRGFHARHRWMSFGLILLAIFLAGFPFTAGAAFVSPFLAQLLVTRALGSLLILFLGLALLISSVLRVAFEPAEEFFADEPIFLIQYGLGMATALAVFLLPQWWALEPVSLSDLPFPSFLLVFSIGLVFLSRLVQRAGENLFSRLERFFRPVWIRPLLGKMGRSAITSLALVEGMLSGEGALLWALSIAVLLFLALKGG